MRIKSVLDYIELVFVAKTNTGLYRSNDINQTKLLLKENPEYFKDAIVSTKYMDEELDKLLQEAHIESLHVEFTE